MSPISEGCDVQCIKGKNGFRGFMSRSAAGNLSKYHFVHTRSFPQQLNKAKKKKYLCGAKHARLSIKILLISYFYKA